MTIDDADTLARKVAYIDTIRSLHKHKRLAGFVGSLIGVVILAWSRLVAGAPEWATYVGLAIIGASWLTFVYVIVSRSRYVRTHPFDSQAS